MPDRSLTCSRVGTLPGPPNQPGFIDLTKSLPPRAMTSTHLDRLAAASSSGRPAVRPAAVGRDPRSSGGYSADLARLVEQRLLEHPLLRERVARLRTIPGVGAITALTSAVEIGDPTRGRKIPRPQQTFFGVVVVPDRPGAVKGARFARRSEPLTARTDLDTLCLPPALQPNHDPVQHKAVAGACGGAVMTNGGRARASAPHGTRPTFVVDRSNRSVGQTAGHKRMRK